jgi:hypothetical protein
MPARYAADFGLALESIPRRVAIGGLGLGFIEQSRR